VTPVPASRLFPRRILLIWLAPAVLIISDAERLQEAASDELSNYKLMPQPVVCDDPDLKLINAPSSEMRDE
jgi:hypothetical protein